MIEKRQIPQDQIIISLVSARLLREQTPVAEASFREWDSQDLPEQLRKNLLTIAWGTWDKAKAISEAKQARIDKLKWLPLKEQLAELTPNYFDIETIQEQLNKVWKLIWKKLEFSKTEIEKSKWLLTESLSEQELSQVIDIIDRVWKENVCFTQLPETWDVDWKTEPYSKRNFREIMLKAHKKDNNIQNMWQWSYVTDDTKDFISNWDLRLFTLECVEWSFDKEWDWKQLDIIEELTWDKNPDEEHAWAWIVWMLKNIKTWKKHLRRTFMRMNVLDTGRGPLDLSSYERDLYLFWSGRNADSNIGVGVSLGFPKR